MWNGSAQSGIKVAQTTSDDYAGIIFRAHDKNNFWHLSYDADNDKLKLCERKSNVDTAHVGMSIGWGPNTWYYLKVRYRYAYITVYTSTDGIVWTERFSFEQAGKAAL